MTNVLQTLLHAEKTRLGGGRLLQVLRISEARACPSDGARDGTPERPSPPTPPGTRSCSSLSRGHQELLGWLNRSDDGAEVRAALLPPFPAAFSSPPPSSVLPVPVL